jgi:hypothetical protein
MTSSRKNQFYPHVFLISAVLLLPIVASRATYAADSHYVKVKGLPPGHVLWIHSEPAGSSERIGFLPYSARHIQNYGCKRFDSSDWCQVIFRGTRGWARERYLADDKARRA